MHMKTSHMDLRAHHSMAAAHWLAERRHSGAHALYDLREAERNGCLVDCAPLTTARSNQSV